MAIQISNKLFTVFTLPPQYGGGVVVNGAAAVVLDTEANVTAALGGAAEIAKGGLLLSTVSDSTAGALPLLLTSAQLASFQPVVVADPGTAAAIPVTKSASISLTIGAGAETNTLAIPTFVGQTLNIVAGVIGAGSRAITSAQAINQTGNTVMTFGQLRDFIALRAVTVAGVLKWTVTSNDGVALS